jgi:hypothetical protein
MVVMSDLRPGRLLPQGIFLVCLKDFGLNLEGRRPLGIRRATWKDNIKIRWDGVDCVDPAQDRNQRKALVNTVMNLWVPENMGKFLSN